MDKMCTQCGNPMNLVPAGVSKRTGKPYNAFYACKACGHTEHADTGRVAQGFNTTEQTIVKNTIEGIVIEVKAMAGEVEGMKDSLEKLTRVIVSLNNAMSKVANVEKTEVDDKNTEIPVID